MSLERTCPTCAAPLPDDAPEGAVCPACEFSAQKTVIEPSLAGSTVPPPVLQMIGGFEILEKLGQGGMGSVYRARQVSLDRMVAFKVLPQQLAEDAEFVARFQREARVAAGLHHPNLVGVYSFGVAEGCHYIAMELIEGENLHQRLKRGPIEIPEALAICTHVACGLQHAWNSAQLVHRDIKPSNIYVSASGEVKVGDLGLAKSLGGDSTGLTQSGAMMGTPHYMSPEQCRGDKAIDFHADIYSLGCTLYEMLAGHPPYPGRDPIAVVRHHLDSPPPALLKELPACPLPLALVVGKMLKKSHRERQPSYEALIAELEEVHGQIERGENGSRSASRVQAEARAAQAKAEAAEARMGKWVGIVLLCAIAGLVAYFVTPSRKTPQEPDAAESPPAPARTGAAATPLPATPTPAPTAPQNSLAPQVPPPSPAVLAAPPPAPDGWEDLLARLTPAEIEKTGHGWSLKDGELFSPATKWAMLPLPCKLSGTSYQVRVKLRQLPAKSLFHVVLPIADRMCGFDLDGRSSGGIYTSLVRVNGKYGKDVPGAVAGKQVNDSEPHDLEVTVRLDGANATITATLDTRPLYTWTGLAAALSQSKDWATTEPGALALGTQAADWAVCAVKVKRLEN